MKYVFVVCACTRIIVVGLPFDVPRPEDVQQAVQLL